MNKVFMSIAVVATLAGVSLSASSAYADACHSLGENSEWNRLMNQMIHEIKAENYKDALKYIKKLDEICPNVPSVHYSAGAVYQKMGDNANAYHHLTIATQNTKSFAVDEDLMKRMWFALYESAHPGVAEFVNGDSDAAQKKMIQGHRTQIDNYKLKLEDDLKFTENMMWTGAGVGIGGVLLSAVGGIIMSSGVGEDTYSFEEFSSSGIHITRSNPQYDAGAIILGVGIGAAVAGAIVAGIGGYRYVKTKDENDTLDIDLNISLNGASFEMRF